MLARTLARVLDVPFSVNDATSFTQVSTVCYTVTQFTSLKMLCRPVVSTKRVLYVTDFRHKLNQPHASDVGEDVDMCIHRLVGYLISIIYVVSLTLLSYRPQTGMNVEQGRFVHQANWI